MRSQLLELTILLDDKIHELVNTDYRASIDWNVIVDESQVQFVFSSISVICPKSNWMDYILKFNPIDESWSYETDFSELKGNTVTPISAIVNINTKSVKVIF